MIIASFTASVIALFIAFWQGYVSRRHNWLALRPYVVSRQNRTKEENGVRLRYELLNVGLGPAIMKKMEVFIGNDLVKGTEEMMPIEEAAHRLLGGKIVFEIKHSASPSEGYCFKANDEYPVAEVYFPKITVSESKILRELLRTVRVVVHYESFYGEKFSYPTAGTTAPTGPM
jgi:hypothetical protein